jgi:lipopolysaccharide/colanic/teichoic acid biosynthesis glycosyltransferase/glycosyltransferase involved in cell wall biosynthesis
MKRRACVVVSSEITVRAFLAPQLAAMQDRYDVTLVVNTANAQLLTELGLIGTLQHLPIVRAISPVHDLSSFVSLFRLMRRERFDLVQSMTPKAGLIAMVAVWLARTPVRVHTFTGQVWATRRGLSRVVLKIVDKVVAACATVALTDSHSQRDALIRERIAPPDRLRVLGKGSVCGVDAGKFRPNPAARRQVRSALAIPETAVILLFLGRLTRDKGVLDLAHAFAMLADELADVHLLVVGPDEQHLRPAVQRLCARHHTRLHVRDFTNGPEDVMAAADVLCLPSYREGFGSVIIEAAAAGVPAVASRIYGIVDAIEEGRTGLLHEPGDVAGMVGQLRRAVSDGPLRHRLGVAGRERAQRDFSQASLTSATIDLFDSLLDAGGPQSTSPSIEVGSSGIAKRELRAPSRDPRAANPMTAARWYPRYGKRALDVAIALVAIPLLAPVAACVALLVRISLGSPVLFRQRRPGLHAEPFVLVKFRSMTDGRDARGHHLPDAERLPTLGRLLRATSLDEIPELWNVLTGDMSLVGPRPLLMEYLPLYTSRQAQRHRVRPGITGLAQVSGRNELGWAERLELDRLYVEQCSLALDLQILARTVWQVVARRGVSQPGHATAEAFTGGEAS